MEILFQQWSSIHKCLYYHLQIPVRWLAQLFVSLTGDIKTNRCVQCSRMWRLVLVYMYQTATQPQHKQSSHTPPKKQPTNKKNGQALNISNYTPIRPDRVEGRPILIYIGHNIIFTYLNIHTNINTHNTNGQNSHQQTHHSFQPIPPRNTASLTTQYYTLGSSISHNYVHLRATSHHLCGSWQTLYQFQNQTNSFQLSLHQPNTREAPTPLHHKHQLYTLQSWSCRIQH